MSTIEWVSAYVGHLVFWTWILRWGGAERLENSLASGFLFSRFAPQWSADGIKLFGWVTVLASTAWFILGLVNAEFRSFRHLF